MKHFKHDLTHYLLPALAIFIASFLVSLDLSDIPVFDILMRSF